MRRGPPGETGRFQSPAPINGYSLMSAGVSESLKYVVITPARNEAQFIELTLKSVTNQTVLPRKWVIVSDGSTDGTDDIVKKYMARHPWIELLRMPERTERHFADRKSTRLNSSHLGI